MKNHDATNEASWLVQQTLTKESTTNTSTTDTSTTDTSTHYHYHYTTTTTPLPLPLTATATHYHSHCPVLETHTHKHKHKHKHTPSDVCGEQNAHVFEKKCTHARTPPPQMLLGSQTKQWRRKKMFRGRRKALGFGTTS